MNLINKVQAYQRITFMMEKNWHWGCVMKLIYIALSRTDSWKMIQVGIAYQDKAFSIVWSCINVYTETTRLAIGSSQLFRRPCSFFYITEDVRCDKLINVFSSYYDNKYTFIIIIKNKLEWTPPSFFTNRSFVVIH